MRYCDALRAITWLEQALGCKQRAVFMSFETTVAHAELTFGTGIIMLGSVEIDSAMPKYSAQPDEIGGRETRSISLMVKDSRSLYMTANYAKWNTEDGLLPAETPRDTCGRPVSTIPGRTRPTADRRKRQRSKKLTQQADFQHLKHRQR
jgi:hypothetical protein